MNDGEVVLDLTPDQLLTTTRAVRRRLDFTRPVPGEIVTECIEIALQAPTASDRQPWHWVVVGDADRKRALVELYRSRYNDRDRPRLSARLGKDRPPNPRITRSAVGFAERMHEAPWLVVPCVWGRTDPNPSTEDQAVLWGSVLFAVWSFALAARARGLGTVYTTVHLGKEREAADVLGIPFDEVTQCGMLPLAYTVGTDFRPAARVPVVDVILWDKW